MTGGWECYIPAGRVGFLSSVDRQQRNHRRLASVLHPLGVQMRISAAAL